MREDLIVDPQFKALTLLDDVQGESIECEGVLEGHICWEFIFQEYLSIDSYLNLSRDEGEV